MSDQSWYKYQLDVERESNAAFHEAGRTARASDRFVAQYRDGYYVVIDRETGLVVPSDPGHYKRYRDGYLWDYAAEFAARDLEAAR